MSSETSTDPVRLKPDTTSDPTYRANVPSNSRSVRLQPDSSNSRSGPLQADSSLQPWQFFVLAALGCATAVTFLVRSQGVTAVILLSLIMGATALVGLAALRAV